MENRYIFDSKSRSRKRRSIERRSSEDSVTPLISRDGSGVVSNSSSLEQCSNRIMVPSKSNTVDTWVNCCTDDTQPSATTQCPPIQTYAGIECPENYYSCADSTKHPEMCYDLDVAPNGYSNSQPLGTKCCPLQFACGKKYEDACVWIGNNYTNQTWVNDYTYRTIDLTFTNPQYLTQAGVWPSCDKGRITPAEVGGIVAAFIIGVCVFGSACLWMVRKRLYRDPARRRRKSAAKCHPKAEQEMSFSSGGTYSKEGYTESSPPTSLRKFEFGFGKVKPWRNRDIKQAIQPENALVPTTDAYGTGEHQFPNPLLHQSNKPTGFTGRSRSSNSHYNQETSTGIGHFNTQSGHVEESVDIEDLGNGITVTREIKVVREHHNASDDDDGSSTFSHSSQFGGSNETSFQRHDHIHSSPFGNSTDSLNITRAEPSTVHSTHGALSSEMPTTYPTSAEAITRDIRPYWSDVQPHMQAPSYSSYYNADVQPRRPSEAQSHSTYQSAKVQPPLPVAPARTYSMHQNAAAGLYSSHPSTFPWPTDAAVRSYT